MPVTYEWTDGRDETIRIPFLPFWLGILKSSNSYRPGRISHILQVTIRLGAVQAQSGQREHTYRSRAACRSRRHCTIRRLRAEGRASKANKLIVFIQMNVRDAAGAAARS
ncbi:hypothetical protein EVAR_27811_1 [Eumeta japonica]|uniref:Uncharacterized protein n=1 Tax=Eumeta variegata TaxID=151549 RepID=A0A4C1VLJ1_EUMVA|nr:hypothetical protein EVAR_27811_1 [Eumeta japonica]